jgi:hypothetical protein
MIMHCLFDSAEDPKSGVFDLRTQVPQLTLLLAYYYDERQGLCQQFIWKLTTLLVDWL